MPDIDRLIKAWKIFRDSNPYEICNGREFRAIREPEYCMGQMIEDTIALLKEHDANHKQDCEHAEHDSVGCLGYYGCTQDDEPIEACKRCEKYTGNVYEAVMLK